MVPGITQALDASNRVQSLNHAEAMRVNRALDEKIYRIGADSIRTIQSEFASIRRNIRSVAEHVVEVFDTPIDSELATGPEQAVVVRRGVGDEPDGDEPPTLKSHLASLKDSMMNTAKSLLSIIPMWMRINGGSRQILDVKSKFQDSRQSQKWSRNYRILIHQSRWNRHWLNLNFGGLRKTTLCPKQMT